MGANPRLSAGSTVGWNWLPLCRWTASARGPQQADHVMRIVTPALDIGSHINASGEPPPEAGAQRTLEAVGSSAWLGAGSGTAPGRPHAVDRELQRALTWALPPTPIMPLHHCRTPGSAPLRPPAAWTCRHATWWGCFIPPRAYIYSVISMLPQQFLARQALRSGRGSSRWWRPPGMTSTRGSPSWPPKSLWPYRERR